MSAKLIETAAALRKMSAENKSEPDAIDEAADLLEAAAKAETVALKSIQAVRRFANEMRSLASMKIGHNCTSEQFVNFWKVRANIWLSELADDLPDLDSGDCATPLAALEDEITRLRTQRDELSKLCDYNERVMHDCLRLAEESPRWRDVVNELPQEAQEVLFVRGGKTVHGAWIGGIFWHNNQKCAAATWMPFPEPPANSDLVPRRSRLVFEPVSADEYNGGA